MNKLESFFLFTSTRSHPHSHRHRHSSDSDLRPPQSDIMTCSGSKGNYLHMRGRLITRVHSKYSPHHHATPHPTHHAHTRTTHTAHAKEVTARRASSSSSSSHDGPGVVVSERSESSPSSSSTSECASSQPTLMQMSGMMERRQIAQRNYVNDNDTVMSESADPAARQ